MLRRLPLTLCAVMLVSAWSAAPAFAVEYGFECITNNVAAQCATEGQYTVDVTDAGGGQVLFTFSNSGPVASSITDVYFDDGTLLGLADPNADSDPGTNFDDPASPSSLPGGNTVTPPFQTTAGFSADADSPITVNGVNPGEEVGILFTLQAGKTFADTLAALALGQTCTTELSCVGSLRIGIHVQAIGPTGGSEGFINGPPDVPDVPDVPEPATLFLLGSGLAAIGAKVRNRNKKQQTSSIQ